MNTPSLPADFLDAMERHWNDAELLWRQQPKRLANADQLYGLAAECGLKALMQKWGMQMTNTGPYERDDRVHADKIWIRYETYRKGRHPTLALPSQNPFLQWRIEHRYARRHSFQERCVEGHMKGAGMVKRVVDQARRVDCCHDNL